MEKSKKQFKWFGEGFDGFPKEAPDACVQYSIFVVDDSKPDQQATQLQDVKAKAFELLKTYAPDYLWQREEFNLTIQGKAGTKALCGSTDFGDSVEDEWFIIFLLRELSKSFPGLWIQATDTDGEFLLIEAANALPKWLNPEVADNRVWIHDGEIAIIPMSKGSSSTSLTAESALAVLKSKQASLLQSEAIQKEAFYRVEKYPTQAKDNCHHSIVIIPRALASYIHRDPKITGLAVEAFHLHEPAFARTVANSKGLSNKATPHNPIPFNDLVEVSIKFTKVSFAQLKCQEILPPQPWRQIFTRETWTQKQHARLETGMKLTCGFEMGLADPDNESIKSSKFVTDTLEAKSGTDVSLASDTEISTWEKRDDPEDWLDIDFADLEARLSGANLRSGDKSGTKPSGFGHRAAEENLEKMVSRFEQFLNDDRAGPDGAEGLEDMDFDDDSDLDSEGEEKSGSFNEAEFAKMMREMMGLPPNAQQVSGNNKSKIDTEDSDTGSEADDPAEIRKLMQEMEAELEKAGALNLNPTSEKLAALRKSKPGKVGKVMEDSDEFVEESEDLTFAKNMLETLKAEGGMGGPAGSMMSVLGVQLPRGEEDPEATDESGTQSKPP
ncbi:MAG: hypothetical protein M1814_004133 [Vezdaea aestivalis]|nr:MAG: hypothetical protein M1814_004133 [Vezdaea aestivalis]